MISQDELHQHYRNLISKIKDDEISKYEHQKIALDLVEVIGRKIDQREDEALTLKNILSTCLDEERLISRVANI